MSDEEPGTLEIEIDGTTACVLLLVVGLVIAWFMKPKPPQTGASEAAMRNRM